MLLTQEIPVHRVLYRTRKDTVGQKIGEPLKTLKMDKKMVWMGAECQIMPGKIVRSEKYLLQPKLQKVEIFSQ